MNQSSGNNLPARLSTEELTRLRELVAAVHEGNGGPAPHNSIVSLAAAVESPKLITVDFQAAAELGQPMVVVQLERQAPAADLLAALSPRELSVAELIAQGLANKQIARRLGLSILTVKDHVHRILVKTGLPNRAAVAAAHRG